MLYIGLLVGLTALIVIVSFIVTAAVRATEAEDYGEEKQTSRMAFAVVGFLVWAVMFGSLTAASSFHIVPTGHVGVVYSFGEIVDQTGDGAVWTMPWEDIKNADTRVQKETFEDIAAASSETQDIRFTVTLNYRVSPDAVQSLYRNVGAGYFDILVPSRIQQILKDETVQYEAIEVTQKRDELRAAVANRLASELAEYSVTVTSLQIDNIDYSQTFNDSIERKQVATQDALEAEERVKEATARGEAALELAKKEAEANAVLDASLTPALLQRQAIAALGDNVSVIMLPAGDGLIIDPSTILNSTAK